MHLHFVAITVVSLLFVAAASAEMPDNCVMRCDANEDSVCGGPDQLEIGQHWAGEVVIDPTEGPGACTWNASISKWEARQYKDCGDFNMDGVVGGPDLVIAGSEFLGKPCVYARKGTIAALCRGNGAPDANCPASSANGWNNVLT